MFPLIPRAIALECAQLALAPDPEFEVQLPLGVVRKASACRSTWLLSAQQLLDCLEIWRTQPWPEVFSDRSGTPGTLVFQADTDRAGFAFPASCALRRTVKAHYFDLRPEKWEGPGVPSLDDVLARAECNLGKDVLIVAHKPLARECLLLAACAAVRGERVFLLDCDVDLVLAQSPDLRAPEPEPCLTRVTLVMIDPRTTMTAMEPKTVVERKLSADVQPDPKFLDAVTQTPYVDQLELVRAYLASSSCDFDFSGIHEAMKYVRVRYPPGFYDDFGNDPVPSFVLADNSLCVGGLHHVRLVDTLGIGAVVSAAATELDDELRRAGVEVLALPDLADDHWSSALGYFDAVVSFVRVQRLLGRIVLVHCYKGISRGPTLVMAYLVSEFGMTVARALRAVQRVRPRSKPSLRFLDDLQRWELTCLGRRETLCVT
jgi:protein-tyrosine phosphatase